MLKSLQSRVVRLEQGRSLGRMELLMVLSQPAGPLAMAAIPNSPLVEALARINPCEADQGTEQC